jgi:putative colanic acid biosysnthesis UDP-glucose lipid carrier transferase
MTQPILFKNSVSIALLALFEVLVASMVSAISIVIAARLNGYTDLVTRPDIIIGVVILCLALIRRPVDAGSQLTIQPGRAALYILARFGIGVGILGLLRYQLEMRTIPSTIFWTWAICTAPVLMFIAYLISRVTQRLLLAAAYNRRAAFAGYNSVSSTLAQQLERNASLCLESCGFFDDRSPERLGMKPNEHLRGNLAMLPIYVKEHAVDVIFVALPLRYIKRVMDLLDDLRDTTASIYYVPDVFVFDLIQARSTEISGIPVVSMCETPFYGYRGITKRLFDVVVSGVAILMLSPVLLTVAIAIKVTSPGPIIFRQKRYGLDGREISVFKFRSMTVTENGPFVVQAAKNDRRLTTIGGFLRKKSIDELPQLFNVLSGSMSLVGPRPHAVAHNEEYRKLIKGYMVRHKVLPGITGWAQVNGCRGETSKLKDMEERVKYDLEYLRHWSPLLDIKILILTAWKIFNDDKAY